MEVYEIKKKEHERRKNVSMLTAQMAEHKLAVSSAALLIVVCFRFFSAYHCSLSLSVFCCKDSSRLLLWLLAFWYLLRWLSFCSPVRPDLTALCLMPKDRWKSARISCRQQNPFTSSNYGLLKTFSYVFWQFPFPWIINFSKPLQAHTTDSFSHKLSTDQTPQTSRAERR